MSLHQLFCTNPAIAEETESPFKLALDPIDRNHVRALRLKAGEHIALVDAASDYFEVEIVRIEGDDIWVRIACHLDAPRKTTPIMLVQGLAKGEKMDTVLRQATELGIAGYYPTAMKRSVVQLDQKKAAKRAERAGQIARSAALQSGRITLPHVEGLSTLPALIERWSAEDAVLLFWEEAPLSDSVSALFDSLHASGTLHDFARIWVVIGPEGGITAEEIDQIEGSDACVFLLSLGETILRTETAGVGACALVANELRVHPEEGI